MKRQIMEMKIKECDAWKGLSYFKKARFPPDVISQENGRCKGSFVTIQA